jgi:hypothetical protein
LTRHAARLVAGTLLLGDIALVGFYVAYTQTGSFHWLLHALFNLDGEANIPAWYTSVQLMLAGVLFLMATLSDTMDRTVSRGYAALVGFGFILLSADEIVGLHESLTALLRPIDVLPRFSGDHGIWIPIYLAVIAAVALITMRQGLAVCRTHRRGCAILAAGAIVFLTGAVGLEIVSYGDLRANGPTDRLYMLLVAAEEGLELLGASVMLIGSAIVTSAIDPVSGLLRSART